MPLIEISTTETAVVKLVKRFGTGYATIEKKDVDGNLAEAPVVLGSFIPVGNYRNDIELYLRRNLKEGANIRIIGSGTYDGDGELLPIIEIVTPEGITLSEYVIQQGWAIPHEEKLNEHRRTNHLIDSLKEARATKAGLWNDTQWSLQHTSLISNELRDATGGKIVRYDSFTDLALLLTMIAFMVYGCVLWRKRYVPMPQVGTYAQSEPIKPENQDPSAPKRPFLTRTALGLAKGAAWNFGLNYIKAKDWTGPIRVLPKDGTTSTDDEKEKPA